MATPPTVFFVVVAYCFLMDSWHIAFDRKVKRKEKSQLRIENSHQGVIIPFTRKEDSFQIPNNNFGVAWRGVLVTRLEILQNPIAPNPATAAVVAARMLSSSVDLLSLLSSLLSISVSDK